MGLKPGGRASEPLAPLLREVDPDTGAVTRELRPAVGHAPSPTSHQELTAAELDEDGLLLQAAHTEVLWIHPGTLEVVRRVSHPLFHGVHSATPRPGGGVVVTCAGTDSVLELDEGGALVAHHFLRDEPFEDAWPGVSDFRLLDHDALKPHAFHPNHATRAGDDLWVTCFEPRDCRSLTRPRAIALPEAIPHDGRLRAGLLWFTQVTGRVVAVDPDTLERRLELDLAALTGERRMLGWCRGVEVVGSRLFVGFTMVRRTRHREVLRMLLRGLEGEKLPTRMVEVDHDGPRGVREIAHGNAAGGTIYGITASSAGAPRRARRPGAPAGSGRRR